MLHPDARFVRTSQKITEVLLGGSGDKARLSVEIFLRRGLRFARRIVAVDIFRWSRCAILSLSEGDLVFEGTRQLRATAPSLGLAALGLDVPRGRGVEVVADWRLSLNGTFFIAPNAGVLAKTGR